MARDYPHEHERRNVLARMRGFRNAYEQRRYGRPQTAEGLLALPESAREHRSDALDVWRLAKKERISPESAAARLGIDPSGIRWWIPETLGRRRGGETALTLRSPVELRPVAFENGVEFVAVRGWKRKEIERAFAIQWAAAHGMATAEELDWLLGRRVAGRPIADTQEGLHKLARRGEIDPGEAYRVLVT